ncbi:hypothetical protein C8J56DRAFT_1059739 [Mycena floridula]|nr:hypothetical protein C8J56DRAFT_1059739 [Mycena floridula]
MPVHRTNLRATQPLVRPVGKIARRTAVNRDITNELKDIRHNCGLATQKPRYRCPNGYQHHRGSTVMFNGATHFVDENHEDFQDLGGFFCHDGARCFGFLDRVPIEQLRGSNRLMALLAERRATEVEAPYRLPRAIHTASSPAPEPREHDNRHIASSPGPARHVWDHEDEDIRPEQDLTNIPQCNVPGAPMNHNNDDVNIRGQDSDSDHQVTSVECTSDIELVDEFRPETKVQIILWTEDNSAPLMFPILSRQENYLKLRDHKPQFGAFGVEVGSALKKLDIASDTWKKVEWGTRIRISNGLLVSLKLKGIRQLVQPGAIFTGIHAGNS